MTATVIPQVKIGHTEVALDAIRIVQVTPPPANWPGREGDYLQLRLYTDESRAAATPIEAVNHTQTVLDAYNFLATQLGATGDYVELRGERLLLATAGYARLGGDPRNPKIFSIHYNDGVAYPMVYSSAEQARAVRQELTEALGPLLLAMPTIITGLGPNIGRG